MRIAGLNPEPWTSWDAQNNKYSDSDIYTKQIQQNEIIKTNEVVLALKALFIAYASCSPEYTHQRAKTSRKMAKCTIATYLHRFSTYNGCGNFTVRHQLSAKNGFVLFIRLR